VEIFGKQSGIQQCRNQMDGLFISGIVTRLAIS
jgi:hypothetical protein